MALCLALCFVNFDRPAQNQFTDSFEHADDGVAYGLPGLAEPICEWAVIYLYG